MRHEEDSTLQKPERKNLLREGVLRLRSLFLPSEGLHIGENRVIVKKDSAGAQQLYFQRLDGTEEAITLAASEVKAERGTTGGTSTTRVTVITPTSGKKIRVISLTMYSASSTVANFEVYFDTGANFASDTTKGIAIMRLKDTDERKFALSWPDGGGPIGAVDDVLSLRTSVDIAGNGVIMVHYREE